MVRPLRSIRLSISPINWRSTPSGLINTRVRSVTVPNSRGLTAKDKTLKTAENPIRHSLRRRGLRREVSLSTPHFGPQIRDQRPHRAEQETDEADGGIHHEPG